MSNRSRNQAAALAEQHQKPSDPSGNLESLRQQSSAGRIRRAKRERVVLWCIRLVSLIVVLGAWQLYGTHTIAILFAPITTVVQSGIMLFAHQGLGGQLLYSLWTFGAGFGCGVLVGIIIGLLMGASRFVESAISMYVAALYATPMIALVPIISLWMGFGTSAQILIVALFVTWPMTVAVFHGVQNIDPELLEVGRSIRLTRVQMWRHVLLPGAVPYMLTGATQGIAVGLVGVFVAEIETQLSGLGDALETQAQTYHTANALAVVLVVMILGVVLRGAISFVKKQIAPWMTLEK